MSTNDNNIAVQQKPSNSNHGLLGMMSGSVVGAILQPLEVIKMGMIVGPADNAHLSHRLKQYGLTKQFVRICQYLKQTEGIRGFYRGLFPAILRGGGGASVYFHSLSKLDEFTFQTKGYDENCVKWHFINSAIARTFSTIVINPLNVVGSRIEIPGFNEYKNFFQGLFKLYKYEGVRGYMRGVVPTIMKEFPFAGIYLVIYRPTKEFLKEIGNLHYATVALISGMIAGIFATMSSHPFEIIRARMQTNAMINSKENKCDGVLEGLQNIYKQEGFYGYFRGLTPRLIKKPLVNTLTFVMFEIFHFNWYQEKW